MIKRLYELAKPGIVYGNITTTLASFLFASRLHPDIMHLIATLLGLSLVIGSACVFNNYIDRRIDALMERTRHRALVEGTISKHDALSLATLLGLLGFFILFEWTNVLTATMAGVGFVFYVVCYSWAKRKAYWGTLVGSVSGAMPIIVGYTAVTERIDYTAIILFLTLVVWQMPHFYAIALNRMSDYERAGIPILPLVYGVRRTKLSIAFYIIVFIFAAETLALKGYVGVSYASVMMIVSGWWLSLAVQGFRRATDPLWSKRRRGAVQRNIRKPARLVTSWRNSVPSRSMGCPRPTP